MKGCMAGGVCMAGGNMHGRGAYVWWRGVCGGGHLWQGACVVGVMHGGGIHGGGMHGRGALMTGGVSWRSVS